MLEVCFDDDVVVEEVIADSDRADLDMSRWHEGLPKCQTRCDNGWKSGSLRARAENMTHRCVLSHPHVAAGFAWRDAKELAEQVGYSTEFSWPVVDGVTLSYADDFKGKATLHCESDSLFSWSDERIEFEVRALTDDLVQQRRVC